VNAVLTGHIGRQSARVLKEAGVRIFLGAGGKVRVALARLADGTLTEA